MSETPGTGLLVINLDRRTDRLRDIAEHLSGHGLEFERVRAEDSADPIRMPPAQIWSAAEHAIYASHHKAWQHVAGMDVQFALILEDDARLEELLDWTSALSDIAHQAASAHIGLLQLGYMTLTWRGRVLYAVREFGGKLTSRVPPPRTLSFRIGKERRKVRLGTFRLGAHAYLLAPPAATILARLPPTAPLPVDLLLSDLAPLLTSRGTLRFGMLVTPLVRQGDGYEGPARGSDNISHSV